MKKENTTQDKQMGLLDAAVIVLGENYEAMTCRQIVQLVIQRELWQPKNGGKTPENTLSAAIRRELKLKGDKNRFRLVERGKFALKR